MTGALILAAIVTVAGLWSLTPFALFGVRRRLDGIVAAQRRHTDELIAEIRRTNAILVAEGHRLFADDLQADRTLLVRSGRA